MNANARAIPAVLRSGSVRLIGDEVRRSSRQSIRGGPAGGRRSFHEDLGEQELQVSAGRRRREDRRLLILEQVLEERPDPVDTRDRTRPAVSEHGGLRPVGIRRATAEADPVEPRVVVHVVVAIVTMSGPKQHPSAAAHRETSAILRDRQHSGLHDDQLMHRQHAVRVPAEQTGSMDAGLYDLLGQRPLSRLLAHPSRFRA